MERQSNSDTARSYSGSHRSQGEMMTGLAAPIKRAEILLAILLGRARVTFTLGSNSGNFQIVALMDLACVSANYSQNRAIV